ncbi:molybdate ABC transporter substrate-binding protein [Paenibacillus antibioticophila]|uniref:Molybdate ABC transporter substrate-binding protein n=1 Tax=Paenibacillus antibioticophila TaxID=1274374 RepID=A0A920CI57_9BACL|nr:molybdate ABC transporter substrate-binding protein [Paenibacillus antibioticophila]GIO37482.1 molybdate ABC transporter substrate-binding protein [Paenibacillus antibioticophila]
MTRLFDEKAMRFLALFFTIALVLSLAACGGTKEARNTEVPAVELTVSAAASLTDALQEIQELYAKEAPNVKLSFNFAASGALQQQIEQGAPVDVFLSASPKNLDPLVESGWIAEDQHQSLLGNELTVVTAADEAASIQDVKDLLKDPFVKVAIGIPESVPAGKYAQEALTNAGVWDELQAKMVQAKDVRQVLQYVETGNAEAGFVYKTDALSSDKVKVAHTVDQSAYTPVIYPIGIMKETSHPEEAKALYDYLQTKEALDVFVKYGFSSPIAQ